MGRGTDLLGLSKTPKTPINPTRLPTGTKDDDLSEFSKGLGAGVDQLQALAGGAYALAGEAIGSEKMFQDGLDYYYDQMAEASAYKPNVGKIEDIGGFSDFVDWSSYMAGNLAPMLLGTGGTGFVAGAAAKKGVQTAIGKKIKDGVKKGVSKGVLTKLPTAQTAGQAVGAASFSGSAIAGDTFVEILDETGNASPTEAIIAGVLGGALDALVPVKALKKITATKNPNALDDVLDAMNQNKNVLDTRIGNAAFDAGIEGLTEAAQEAITMTAVDVVDVDSGFMERVVSEEGISRLINAAAAGALMGGAIGGATGGRTEVSSPIDEGERLAREALEQAPMRQSSLLTVDESVAPGKEVARAMTPSERYDYYWSKQVPKTDFTATPAGDVFAGSTDFTQMPKGENVDSPATDSIYLRAARANARAEEINRQSKQMEFERREEIEMLRTAFTQQKENDPALRYEEEEFIRIVGNQPHSKIKWYPPESALSLIDKSGGFNTREGDFDALPKFKLPQTGRNPFRTRSGRQEDFISAGINARTFGRSSFGKSEPDEIMQLLREEGLNLEEMFGAGESDSALLGEIIDQEILFYTSGGREGRVFLPLNNTKNKTWEEQTLENERWEQFRQQQEEELFGGMTLEDIRTTEEIEAELIGEVMTPETVERATMAAQDVDQERTTGTQEEDLSESAIDEQGRTSPAQEEKVAVQSGKFTLRGGIEPASRPVQEVTAEETAPPSPPPADLNTAELQDTPGFAAADQQISDYFIRKFQDKLVPLKRLEQEIAKARGADRLTADESTYDAEARYYGIVEEDFFKFEKGEVEPLIKKMAKYNISEKELSDYLYAKHAKERNAYIAQINPSIQDGGSGITNADADAIFAQAKNQNKETQLEELASDVYKITQGTRDLLQEGGLLDESELSAWQSTYEFYVPLKGFAENEGGSRSGTGSGFSTKGKESQRAKGRTSEAESPLLQLIAQRHEKIIRKRKNDVGKKFLQTVQANPNPDLFQVYTEDNPPVTRTMVSTKEGDKVTPQQSMFAALQERISFNDAIPNPKHRIPQKVLDRIPTKDKEVFKYYGVKVDGKQVLIEIKDPVLNAAMQNVGSVEAMGSITQVAFTINRWLSTVNTTLSPEFMVRNFSRDIQTAVMNVMAEQDLHNGKIAGENLVKSIIADTYDSVITFGKMTRQRTTGKEKNLTNKQREISRYYQDFMSDGAKTGWFYQRDTKELARDVENLIKSAEGNKSANQKAQQKFKDGLVFIEDINLSVENGVRLATYMNARKAGVSREQAANLAKDLTVNFNRKGELGAAINSWYLFYNASIQGVANVARAVATPKIVDEGQGYFGSNKKMNAAQKVAVGMVGVAGMAAMANEAASEEDEDGVTFYSKIPDYEKERHFIIMKDNGIDYWKIPLPYGYNIFHNLGTVTAEVSMGIRTVAEGASFMGKATINAFSPIGRSLFPTMSEPIKELYTNEDWKGAPIYVEDRYDQGFPSSSRAKRSTRETPSEKWSIPLAKWLNEVTGGSDNISGFADIPPDIFNYAFDWLLGGIGRFGEDIYDTTLKLTRNQELESKDIPFVRIVNAESQEYVNSKIYYDRLGELKQIINEYDSLRGDERKAFREEYKGHIGMINTEKNTAKSLRKLRERRKAVENSKVGLVQRNERLSDIQDDMNTVYKKFNKQWNERIGK